MKSMIQGLEKNQLPKLRVAVAGAGIVSSICQDVPTLTNRLCAGYMGITHSQWFTDLPFPLIAVELNNLVFEGSLRDFLKLLSANFMKNAYALGSYASSCRK